MDEFEGANRQRLFGKLRNMMQNAFTSECDESIMIERDMERARFATEIVFETHNY